MTGVPLFTGKIFRNQWIKERGDVIEGVNLPDALAIKKAVGIPVICTGGFQTASVIQQAITSGACDAVSMARTLIANPTLPQMFKDGMDRPPVPCTYWQQVSDQRDREPARCYDQDRYTTREAMIADILSVFNPPPFAETQPENSERSSALGA